MNIRRSLAWFLDSSASRRNTLLRVALVATTALAFAVLTFDLDGQSMWNDEGLSVYRARQPVGSILQNTITIDGVVTKDTNPPLFFLFLAGWRQVVGESVFALRSLGILAALLNIPLIYQLASLATGRQVGLTAAVLLAISPFHTWQSQELRNYSFLLFFNLLSVYGLFRFLLWSGRGGRWRWLILWSSAGVAGIYTHYFGAFVFAFGIISLLLWFASRPGWRPSRRVIVGLLIVGMTGLPVIAAGLSRFQAGRQIDFVFVPPHHLLSHMVSAFGVGIVHGFVQPQWRVIPVVLLMLAGMVLLRQRGRLSALALLTGYLVTPFALLLLLSAINPIYNGPRHLYPSLPPFLILVAAGLALPWYKDIDAGKSSAFRWMTFTLSLILLGSQLSWLDTQFSSEELVKDEIRGLATYLEQVALDDDLIVLHDTITGVTFNYYYQGRAPWIAVPALYQTDRQAAIDRLITESKEFQRVWFVSKPSPRSGFPRQAVSDWIEEQWPRLESRQFPSLWLDLKLELYAPRPEVIVLPDGVTPTEATWPGGLTLNGFKSPESVAAGSEWQPVSYWSRSSEVSERFKLSLRFVDELGVIWHQNDIELWGDYPPADWPSERIIRFAPILHLPAGVPPGKYRLWLRVIRADSPDPLLIEGAADLPLIELSVNSAMGRPGVGQLPIQQLVNRQFGGQIELVGFNVPAGEYRPGHTVPVDLLWRVSRPPKTDYQLLAQLRDTAGQVVSEQVTTLTRAAYRPSSWKEGEILRGKAAPVIPADVPGGSLELTVALIHPESLQPLAIDWFLGPKYIALTSIPITPWPLETEMPPISNQIKAEFGQPEAVELYGFDLSNEKPGPGESVEITLYWRSLSGEIKTSYSVFVHLAGEDETILAQSDGLPASGFRPTTSWRANEVIVDLHNLSLPESPEPGNYRMWVGLYDPQTDLRMPLYSRGERLPDDRLLLATLPVVP